jgi:site-specific recombinase XerD/transposase InsO family protein
MSQKRAFTYPNLLAQRFNVSNPFSVLCADCTQLRITLKDKPEQKLYLFCVLDLCTSQVVTSYVFTRISSKRMKDSILSHLSRKEQTIYEKQKTIIHSDRGSEFCNKNWASLDDNEYVSLSMSRMAKPTDNAVIERFFGTLKRDKKILGQTGQYNTIPLFIENIDELRALVDNIMYRYNIGYKPKRTQYVPPDSFYELIYSDQKENPQTVVIASTRFDEKTTNNIELYKKELLVAQNIKLNQMNGKLDIINYNQIQMATGMGYKLDEVVTRLESIEQKVTKSSVIKRKPRLLRDALMNEHLELFLETSLDYKPYISIRNKTAIILLCALGCRNSEILEMKFKDIESLIIEKQIALYIKKTGKKVFQPISDYHANLLELFYNDLISSVGEINQDWYVFTSFRDKTGSFLHVNHFNKILNSSLQSFCLKCDINKKYQTHSGRIGYVTSLLQSGSDISIVAKMVNHDDIRSTTKYDRYTLDFRAKRDILNKNNPKQK